MHVELIEHLRCPRHAGEAPPPLVAAATRTVHRHLIEGVLGCHVCGAEYPVSAGVTRFAPSTPLPAAAPDMEVAMRLAAFLELTDAAGFAVLFGRWAAHVTPLAALIQTPLMLVNPPADTGLDGAAAVIECGAELPLVAARARAAALDPALGLPLHDALECVRPGGRVLAPHDAPVPEGVREIARDAREWVGERTAAPEPAPRLVALKRGGAR